jgi:flagellum-specific peptidoglycan hydrolase FlgJ
VWATDPNYDRKVLGIYRLMVETARSLDRSQV